MSAIHKEEFIVDGHNGRPMLADLHYPAGEKKLRVVIYAHGINGFKDWGGMDLIAREFAKHGLAFLKFNFSHNGTTPKQPVDFVDLEAYGNDNYSIRQQELNLVTHYALKPGIFSFQVEGLSLIGHSRGGTDAIINAASNNRVDQLITWAAVDDATTPWRNWEAEKLEQWREEGVVYIENKRTQQQLPIYYQLMEDYKRNRAQLNVEEAARSLEIPWLICHGDADEAVFVKAAYDLKDYNPAANIKIISKTGHTFDRNHPWSQDQLPEASQELIEHNLDFIKSYSD